MYNKSMFDPNHYLTDKIINRISSTNIYKKDNDWFKKLLESFNFGIASNINETAEDSVIGWVSFCKAVEQIDAVNGDFSVESIFNLLKASKPKTQSSQPARLEDIVDESLLVEESPEVKMSRLLSIASEVDVLDGFEQSELSEEGLREQGIIQRNATSLDAEDVVSVDTMPYIRIKSIDDKIVSPITGSSDVFCIDDNTWMDIDTEQKFKVYYEGESESS